MAKEKEVCAFFAHSELERNSLQFKKKVKEEGSEVYDKIVQLKMLWI
jgi:hypothetical protein